MSNKDIALRDGIELSAVLFASIRADVTYFVNAGGVAYLTSHGRRRMALVPVAVGEAYERLKAADTDESARIDAIVGVLKELGVDPATVQVRTADELTEGQAAANEPAAALSDHGFD